MAASVAQLRDTIAAPTLDPALADLGSFGVFAQQAIASSVAGPCALLGTLAQTAGVYDDAIAAVRSVTARAYALFSDASNALQLAAAAVKSKLAAQARAAILSVSSALQDLIGDVQGLANLAKAVPVAGQIVQTAIAVVKLAASTIRGLFSFARAEVQNCPPVNIAKTFGDLDSQQALALLGMIGDPALAGDPGGRISDLTAVFSAPDNFRTLEIERLKYTGDSFFAPFAYAPLFGAIPSYISKPFGLGSREDAKTEDARAAWDSLRWQLGGYNAPCPWLFHADKSKRNPNSRMTAPIGAAPAQFSAVPVNPFPKSTSIAQAIWAQVTSNGPAALCVDWSKVKTSWESAYLNLGTGSNPTLDQCQTRVGYPSQTLRGTVYAYGTRDNLKAARAFRDDPTYATGQLNLGADFLNYVRALPIIEDSSFRGDDYWRGDALALGYRAPGIGVYAPQFYGRFPIVINYACDRLRLRQLQIAATTAAAYVPAGVLESMGPGFLRARLETTRAQILETGARGVDLQIAAAADPVYAQACAAARVQWKKTALMTGTPAPKPDTAPGASAALAGVQDFSPGPSDKTGVGPVLALGGLGLIFAMMGRGNG